MAKPNLITAIFRGLAGHCPNCGEGRLFRAYLKVDPACQSCGHDLDQYPADDGPAYLTILLIGHLVIAPLFLFPFMWRSNPWVLVPVAVVGLMALVLIALPRVKGGFIGLLYHLKIRRRDAHLHTADRAE